MNDNEILNLIKEKRYNAMCDEEYTLNNDKKNLSKLSNLRITIQTYTDLIIEIENRMNKKKRKIGDYTLREATKYCDDRAKENNGLHDCNGCPFVDICGDYLDTFDEELEIEVE